MVKTFIQVANLVISSDNLSIISEIKHNLTKEAQIDVFLTLVAILL